MFNALPIILATLWTGIIFAVSFTLDNPTKEELHFFNEHPAALLGIALFYAFGLIVILFVPKILFRRNAASLLRTYGIGRPEIYQNDFFYTDKNGWDVALDRREHKIAFMLYPKIIVYDFKDMGDFGILIEKNIFNKDERDIYLNCFFGKQGVEMISVRAGKIRIAEKFIRALQGVAPSGKLSQATKELRAALKPGQTTLGEDDENTEESTPKIPVHQPPQDEAKHTAEAERRASFEEERRRIIESERQKMLAELQAMVMQQEDTRNMPGAAISEPAKPSIPQAPKPQEPLKPESPAPAAASSSATEEPETTN